MNKRPIIINCTTPDFETAASIAEKLINKKLAACCNILKNVQSIYVWQDKICRDEECLMVIKSIASKYDSIEKEILMNHPYDFPEVISMNIDNGSESYIKWISENTGL